MLNQLTCGRLLLLEEERHGARRARGKAPSCFKAPRHTASKHQVCALVALSTGCQGGSRRGLKDWNHS